MNKSIYVTIYLHVYIPRNMLSATSVIWFRCSKLSRMGSNKWLGTRLHNSLIFFEPNLVASSARTCWQRASKDGISNISPNARDNNNMVNMQRISHLWIPSSDKTFNKLLDERLFEIWLVMGWFCNALITTYLDLFPSAFSQS